MISGLISSLICLFFLPLSSTYISYAVIFLFSFPSSLSPSFGIPIWNNYSFSLLLFSFSIPTLLLKLLFKIFPFPYPSFHSLLFSFFFLFFFLFILFSSSLLFKLLPQLLHFIPFSPYSFFLTSSPLSTIYPIFPFPLFPF